jgi:methyltransferase (TIGR00027 family)
MRTKSLVEYQPSDTAMGTAFLRALSTFDKREEVRGPDYLAEIFLTEDKTLPLKDAISREWVLKNKTTPGMYEYMIARTAFFDRAVQQALGENIPQIVFLGAGYDSRSYRFRELIRDTRLFELDARPTQERKKEMLQQAGIIPPEVLTFVPINFQTDDLSETLCGAGFRPECKTIFIWEGVTYYLSAGAVENTLRIIKSNSPSGSSIGFDYAVLSPEKERSSDAQRIREWIKSRYPGEPTRFGIMQGKLESYLTDKGYTIVEHLAPKEMQEKYLTLRDGSSAGPLPPHLCLVNASVS